MNDEELEQKLKDEVSEGMAMKAACNNVLNSFFERKEQQLFAAFTNVKVGDEDQLIGIHHACMAIQSLQLEVKGVIDGGKLAAAQLETMHQR